MVALTYSRWLLALALFTAPYAHTNETNEPSRAEERLEKLIEQLKDANKKPESTGKRIIKQLAPLVFGVLCVELCFLTAPEETQASLLDQIQPKNLALNIGKEYAKRLFTTFMHELGHALTAKALCDNKIDIHLGGSSRDKPSHKPLLTVGPIAIDGINPCTGYSITQTTTDLMLYALSQLPAYCQEHNCSLLELDDKQLHEALAAIMTSDTFLDVAQNIEKNKKKKALILLAGGACGALSNVILRTLSAKSRGLSGALKHGFAPDSITMHNLFNMLVPYGSSGESDASKLYIDCLGLSKKAVTTIGSITPALDMLFECWLAFQDERNAGPASPHAAMLVGLANFFFRGFAQFHV